MKNKIVLGGSLTIIGMLLVTAGITFAFFNYIGVGNAANTLTAGTVELHFDETSKIGEGVTITDALPVDSNKAEQTRTDHYDFNITGKSTSMDVSYVVTARKSEDSGNLDDILILYLTDDEDDFLFEGMHRYSDLIQYRKKTEYTEKVIYTGTVEAGDANYNKNFRLRMWIDENADFSGVLNETTGEMEYPYQDQTFKLTINVYTDTDIDNYNGHHIAGLYDHDWDMLYSWDELEALGMSTSNGRLTGVTMVLENNNLEGRLVLPSTITTIGSSAFSGTQNLESVELQDGVTTIETGAFRSSTIKNINIPNTVTTIESFAFAFSKLQEVYIPASVTTIGNEAFSNATELETAIIKANISTIDRLTFQGNSKLRKVELPDTLTKIQAYAFTGTAALEEIEIPNSVEIIEYDAFYNSGIKNLKLSANLKEIGNDAFSYCNSLEEVTIPNGVTTVGSYVFAYNNSLKKATVPNTITSNGGDMFYYDESLSEVIIEDGATIIGQSDFYSCKSISVLTIPASVTSIGSGAFNYGVKVLHYEGPAEDTNNDNWGALVRNPYIEGDFVYSDSTKTRLAVYLGNDKDVTIPNGVTTIGRMAFNNTTVENVVIANTVTSIEADAFSSTNIITIEVPNTVTSIGDYAFGGIKILYYTGSAGDSTDRWGALSRNPYVEGDFVYANSTKTTLTAYIGNSENVVIPEGVVTINQAFKNDKFIKSVTIPSSVASISNMSFASSLENATFTNTTGWSVKPFYSDTVTNISSEDLADTQKAATYLVNSYSYYDWTRSN